MEKKIARFHVSLVSITSNDVRQELMAELFRDYPSSSAWQMEVEAVPQQHGNYECGTHTILWAESIMAEDPQDFFTQKDFTKTE